MPRMPRRTVSDSASSPVRVIPRRSWSPATRVAPLDDYRSSGTGTMGALTEGQQVFHARPSSAGSDKSPESARGRKAGSKHGHPRSSVSESAGILFKGTKASNGRATRTSPATSPKGLSVPRSSLRIDRPNSTAGAAAGAGASTPGTSRKLDLYRQRQQEQRRDDEQRKADKILGEKRAYYARRNRRPKVCCSCHHICGDVLESSDFPIENFIILGDREMAKSRNRLIALGVTHVLNAAQQLRNYHEDSFIYCHVDMLDSPKENIHEHLPRALAFIDDAKRQRTNILVHCISGVSRSVTLVTAWLIVRKRMKLADALRAIKHHRPLSHPNETFLMALAELEITTLGASSVATTKDLMWHFPKWQKRQKEVPTFGFRGKIIPPEKRSSCCTIM